MPAREAREKLYVLYRSKWIDYVELSKRGDFNTASNFFFWYLDTEKLKSSIINHHYHTLYNLILRQTHEVEVNRDALEVVPHTSSDAKRNRMANARLNILDKSIQRTDRGLLLLEFF